MIIRNILSTFTYTSLHDHFFPCNYFSFPSFFFFLLLKSTEANLSATLAVQIDFQKAPDKARKIVAPCERKALARDMENEKLPPTNLIPHPGADRW